MPDEKDSSAMQAMSAARNADAHVSAELRALADNDPLIHAWLTIAKRDGLSEVELLRGLVIDLAKHKAQLLGRVRELTSLRPTTYIVSADIAAGKQVAL